MVKTGLLFLYLAVEIGVARPPCPTATCPKDTCIKTSCPKSETWNSSDCANITALGFDVRPSAQNQTCRLYDILTSYWDNSPVGTLVPAANITSPAISPNLGIACPSRILNSDLIGFSSTQNLLRCGSSQDCILENGSETDCVCGLDGNSYCLPHSSSAVFDAFWEECDRWGNFSRYKYWKRWVYFSSYYVMWATSANLTCVKQTIMEIEAILEEIDSAELLIVSFLLGLSL